MHAANIIRKIGKKAVKITCGLAAVADYLKKDICIFVLDVFHKRLQMREQRRLAADKTKMVAWPFQVKYFLRGLEDICQANIFMRWLVLIKTIGTAVIAG